MIVKRAFWSIGIAVANEARRWILPCRQGANQPLDLPGSSLRHEDLPAPLRYVDSSSLERTSANHAKRSAGVDVRGGGSFSATGWLWLTSGSDQVRLKNETGRSAQLASGEGRRISSVLLWPQQLSQPTLENLFAGRSGAAREPILKLTNPHLVLRFEPPYCDDQPRGLAGSDVAPALVLLGSGETRPRGRA